MPRSKFSCRFIWSKDSNVSSQSVKKLSWLFPMLRGQRQSSAKEGAKVAGKIAEAAEYLQVLHLLVERMRVVGIFARHVDRLQRRGR